MLTESSVPALIDPAKFTVSTFAACSFVNNTLRCFTLSTVMLDKMSDTSRIVDRLIAKGLVKKVVCKADKRLVDVSITDKGKKLLEKTDKYEPEMDAMFGALTEADAKTLNKLLDKLRNSD